MRGAKGLIMISIILGIILSGCGVGYQVNEEGVYYKYWDEAHGFNSIKMTYADPTTFIALSPHYAKDKNHAYHQATIIKGADPKTFLVTDKHGAKDQNWSYVWEERRARSTNDHVRRLGATNYIIDYINEEVYYYSLKMNVYEARNFKVIDEDINSTGHYGANHPWATDGKYYYAGGSRVPSEDYKNIRIFKGTFVSKDRYFVYSQDKKLQDVLKNNDDAAVDVASFDLVDARRRIFKDNAGCIQLFIGRVECVPQKN